jgi:hypothetical protein
MTLTGFWQLITILFTADLEELQVSSLEGNVSSTWFVKDFKLLVCKRKCR